MKEQNEIHNLMNYTADKKKTICVACNMNAGVILLGVTTIMG
jgi:hypothetical protein